MEPQLGYNIYRHSLIKKIYEGDKDKDPDGIVYRLVKMMDILAVKQGIVIEDKIEEEEDEQ